MNKFLRTASTQRLLAMIAGFVVAIAGGTAIAIAATSGGPIPKSKRLAVAIRDAMAAPNVSGISADISFTNHLIDTAEIQGSDPLLSGGSGHVWISADGRLRLELYGDNGDPAVVVNKTSWWISDPSSSTVYEGTMPAGSGAQGKTASKNETLPTVAEIQAAINHLAQHLRIGGAVPTDLGGQPAYTVRVSPRVGGGLLGQAQLAWDALKGVPLRFALYARGDSSPVLELAATNVSYGSVDSGVFKISPPSGYKVVKVATPAGTGADAQSGSESKKHKRLSQVTGVKAVAKDLSFGLVAPGTLSGMTRQSVTLLDWGGHPAALLTYGQGLGGIAVIEQAATASSARGLTLSSGAGEHAHGISLPTYSVHGTTAQELDTALGTVMRFTSGGVTYTVIGSVKPRVARAAARAL